MNRFERSNIITGWAVFFIATTVYALTVEPTASFWDCSEFIATSFKLEVPHAPGAPLFLLLGRMFSLLAGGNVHKVAYWINHLSVLASGFTILFLFWSITLLARKIINLKSSALKPSQTFMILAAGFIGSMVYTFSDSFWFSSEEAEVYAMSSFFTAFVFWAMLKWELIEGESRANRWLILIFYMMGLSIGVHLLNLVTIPALALIYYFRKYKPSFKGIAFTILIGVLLILFITGFIIPGLPSLAWMFEIFFVNSVGLPFQSGIFIFILLFIGSLTGLIIYTQKKKLELLNTILLGFSFIIIGYSSYSLVLIRSNFNPPIDEDNPDNIVNYISYLKREQYESTPLFYGQYFDASVVDQEKEAPIYVKGNDDYKVAGYKFRNIYDPKRETIIPRAWSSRDNEPQAYRQWMGLGTRGVPDFLDNIKFMFTYQFGHMYMRYLLWNFAGKESDIQNAGWLKPWESTKDLPQQLKNNKGRNNYYMFPLLLGILGLFYNYKKDKKVFYILLAFFVFTGIALAFYTNSPAIEPRERDYIYVGSFYAFAIWVAVGALAVMEFFATFIKHNDIGIVAGLVVCLAAPALMATQNWNDHDRSNRYFSVDSAKNFLASCPPNAILFTGGDNDTFPLWYVQEVEGYRTDVRVIVETYFDTDWYIDQMTRQAYQSKPLPISLNHDQYKNGGPDDYLPYIENPNLKDKAISLKGYIRLLEKNYQALQVPTKFGNLNTLPAKALFLDVNKPEVMAGDLIPQNILDEIRADSVKDVLSKGTNQYAGKPEVEIPVRMIFKIKKDFLTKSNLMILDIIANNNWKRPICFTTTALMNLEFDLTPYVVREGLTYRLLPVQNNDLNNTLVDTDRMYKNVMDKFTFRELDNPAVDYNEDYRGFVYNHRDTFNILATALLREGHVEKAKKVIYRNLTVMPDASVPYDLTTARTVSLLVFSGEKTKAEKIGKILSGRSEKFLAYYLDHKTLDGNEVSINLYILNEMAGVFRDLGEKDFASQLESKFMNYYRQFNR